MQLSNKYYSLIPHSNPYGTVSNFLESYSIDSEKEKLNEIYDFGTSLKLSLAAIQD